MSDALEILDVIDTIVDDTHPEGDGCPLCSALDELREALEPDPRPRPEPPVYAGPGEYPKPETEHGRALGDRLKRVWGDLDRSIWNVEQEAAYRALAESPAREEPVGETWRCPSCRDTVAVMGMCQKCGVFGLRYESPARSREEPGLDRHPSFDHGGTARHHHDSETGDPVWWLGCEQFGGEVRDHLHGPTGAEFDRPAQP